MKKIRQTLLFGDKEADILDKFAMRIAVSKADLMRKCLLYCWDNMIDVSDVKLPSENTKNIIDQCDVIKILKTYVQKVGKAENTKQLREIVGELKTELDLKQIKMEKEEK